jgi:T5orf172 domain
LLGSNRQQQRNLQQSKAKRKSKRAREALRILGDREFTLLRQIQCLASESSIPNTADPEVKVPDLHSAAGGFWRALQPSEFGEDQDGHPIIGRTWVERRETWFKHDPASFLIHTTNQTPQGPAPGTIYIIRSPSHEIDLYKVGLSKREVAKRAQEIGHATGVPLPFGVLATWEVGDCRTIEIKVHRALAHYRVSKRREFFSAPLPRIISIIDRVIKHDSEPS